MLFAAGALVAVILPLSSPSLKAADVGGVPAQVVPVDSSGYVRCGGSVLSIRLHGANVPDVGPATGTIAAACNNEARNLLVGTAGASALALGIAGWYVQDRRRRSRVAVTP
jgi:hypothetical protein